jgi:hypothetical protein
MYVSGEVVVAAVRAAESSLVYSNLVPDKNDCALIHSGNASRKSNNLEARAPVISFAPTDHRIYSFCEQCIDAFRKAATILNRQATETGN